MLWHKSCTVYRKCISDSASNCPAVSKVVESPSLLDYDPNSVLLLLMMMATVRELLMLLITIFLPVHDMLVLFVVVCALTPDFLLASSTS